MGVCDFFFFKNLRFNVAYFKVSTEDHPSTLPSRLPLARLENSADIGPIIFLQAVIAPPSLVSGAHAAPPPLLSPSPGPEPQQNHSSEAGSSTGKANENGDHISTFYHPTIIVSAISANGERIYVWRVLATSVETSTPPMVPLSASGTALAPVPARPKKETWVTSHILAAHELPAEKSVTCAALVGHSDTVPYSPLLITGGNDGFVRLWCVAPVGSTHKLREMTSFQAYSNPVAVLKASYFGRIATASKSNNNEVWIWELESATPAYKLECKLYFNPPPQSASGEDGDSSALTFGGGVGGSMLGNLGVSPLGRSGNLGSSSGSAQQKKPVSHEADKEDHDLYFDWLALANGKYILAVGRGKEVKIFGQRRPKQLQSFQVEWEVTDSFSSLQHPVRAISWGNDATLVVASDNILYAFSKWRDLHSSVNSREAQQKEDESWITIFHKNSEYSSLPQYHPKVLFEFLMAGHFERVGFILSRVLDILAAKEAAGDKSKDIFIPTNLLADIAHLKKGLVINRDEAKAEKKKTKPKEDSVTMGKGSDESDEEEEDDDTGMKLSVDDNDEEEEAPVRVRVHACQHSFTYLCHCYTGGRNFEITGRNIAKGQVWS